MSIASQLGKMGKKTRKNLRKLIMPKKIQITINDKTFYYSDLKLVSLNIYDSIDNHPDTFRISYFRQGVFKEEDKVKIHIYSKNEKAVCMYGIHFVNYIEHDLANNIYTAECSYYRNYGVYRVRPWYNKTLKEIIKQCAEEDGYRGSETSVNLKIGYYGQFFETNTQLLYRLARAYGNYFTIKDDKMIINNYPVVPDNSEIMKIRIDKLTECSINKSLRSKFKETNMIFRNFTKGKSEVGKWGHVQKTSDLAYKGHDANKIAKDGVPRMQQRTPVSSVESANARARAKMERAVPVTGYLKFIDNTGDKIFKAGCFFKIRGTHYADTPFLVREVTHYVLPTGHTQHVWFESRDPDFYIRDTKKQSAESTSQPDEQEENIMETAI